MRHIYPELLYYYACMIIRNWLILQRMQHMLDQIDVQKGGEEGQRGGILMRAIHPSAAQLPPVHLVRAPSSELRMGEPARRYHQRGGHPAGDLVHRHIRMVCTSREEGKWLCRRRIIYLLSFIIHTYV